MSVPRAESPQMSSVFEKMDWERLRESREASDSAKRTMDKSHELVDWTPQIIERVHNRRRKAC